MAELFKKLQNKNKLNIEEIKHLDIELIPTVIYDDVISKDMLIINRVFYFDKILVKSLHFLYGQLKFAYELGGNNLRTGYIPIRYECIYTDNVNYLTQDMGSKIHRYMILYGNNNSNMSFLSFVLGSFLQEKSTISYNLSNNLKICKRRNFFIPTDGIQLDYLDSLSNKNKDKNEQWIDNIVKETIKIDNLEINNNIVYFELKFNKKYKWFYSFDGVLTQHKSSVNTWYMDNISHGSHNIVVYLLDNNKIINYDFINIVIYSTIYSNMHDQVLEIKYISSTNYYVTVQNNEYKFCINGANIYNDEVVLKRGYSYIFKIIVKGYPFNIGTGWKESDKKIVIISNSEDDRYTVNKINSIESPNILYVDIPFNYSDDLFYYNFNDQSMMGKIKIIDNVL